MRKGHFAVPDDKKTPRLRLSGSELALFTRQLATLANASLPLEEALFVIGRQNKNNKLGLVLHDLRERILAGHTLSESLAAWPRIFDTVYRTLVKAGEKADSSAVCWKSCLTTMSYARQHAVNSSSQWCTLPC